MKTRTCLLLLGLWAWTGLPTAQAQPTKTPRLPAKEFLPLPVRLELSVTAVAGNGPEPRSITGPQPYVLTARPLPLTTITADTLPRTRLVVGSADRPAAVARQLLQQLRSGSKAYKELVYKSLAWQRLLLPAKTTLPATRRAQYRAASAFLQELTQQLDELRLPEPLTDQTARKPAGRLLAREVPADHDQDSLAIKQNSLQVGVGLGGALALQQAYSYALMAPDYRLSVEKERALWPVASAILCYNPQHYYIKLGDEHKSLSEQQVELKSSRWGAMAALNFNDAFSSSLSFNQRISLGVGGGYRVGEGSHCYVALFLEGRLARHLRDGYEANQPLPTFPTPTASSGVLTSLNLSDDTYFTTRPVVGVGAKLVFILTGGAPRFPVFVKEQEPTKTLENKASENSTTPADQTQGKE